MQATIGEPKRKPHAVQDSPSRRLKALKIEKLLGLEASDKPLRVLEIGCGIGGISHYFGTHPSIACQVDAVDVVDIRQFTEGFRFTQVKDTVLPFADASFDVVISNHVIEHVGGNLRQREHLAEIHRVMKLGARGYLAVPNRWQLVEPHYRLAFLSWWPRPLRTPYLKLFRNEPYYDCEPLTVGEVESLLGLSGFTFENACLQAARLMLEIESPDSALASVMRRIPDALLRPLRRVIPTLIYLYRRS